MERTPRIKPWWNDAQDDVHGNLCRAVDHFVKRDAAPRDDLLFHLALGGDRGAMEGVTARHRWERTRRDGTLSFNLIKAVVDTLQSEIAALTPLPRFLTQKGRWELRRRAQDLELMCEAEYDRNGVHEMAPMAFRDAALLGMTALKVCNEGGLPKIERVFPGELIVDPIEAQYGSPRTLYHFKLIPKDSLRGAWGDDKAKLNKINEQMEAPKTLFPWLPKDSLVEQVSICEAWRLPDPPNWPNARPGRHAIAIDNVTLLDEEWKRERFPICWWRYDEDSTTFYGSGIGKNLRAAQIELSYALEKIQRCMHLSSGFRYLVEGNSRVEVEHLTNTPGEILRYFGAVPPQVEIQDTVPEQFFRHAEDVIRRGFEQEGVSMMAATSRKPEGLDSGAAIREFNDLGSRRFQVKTRSFEKFIGVDLARLLVDEKIALAQSGEDHAVKVVTQKKRGVTVRSIDWKSAHLEEKDYGIRVFPASALPSTPAGRTATVEQWFAAGWISRDQAMSLLDFPDLEEFISMELSAKEIVMDGLDQIMTDGIYVPPEPTQDLDLSIQLSQSAYQRYKYEGAPEERLELVLRYMDDCQHLLEQATASMQADQEQQIAGAVGAEEQAKVSAQAMGPGEQAVPEGAPN